MNETRHHPARTTSHRPPSGLSWRSLHGAPMGARGFSLLELMIVVAVIAILAALAYPSYQKQIMQSNRVQAKNGLLDLASREERYYAINNQYTQILSNLGYTGTGTGNQWSMVSGNSNSYYTLTVTATGANNQAFSATAVPFSNQTSDTTCYTYTLDQLGNKGNVDSGGNTLSSASCW